jgi:hypothetical protein
MMLDIGVRTIFEFPTISQLANSVINGDKERPMSSLMGEGDIERILERVASMPEAEVQRLKRELRIR